MISSARDRRNFQLLFALYLLLFLLRFEMWNGVGADSVFYYSYISSPLFDGDVHTTNDVALATNLPADTEELLRNISPATGHTLNVFAAGTGLLWFPFVAPVRVLGIAAGWVFSQPPGWVDDRYAAPYLFALSIGTVFYGYLAVALVYRLCRIWFRPRPSLLAAASAIAATPLLVYAFSATSMSHAHSALAASLVLLVSIQRRKFRRAGDYALIGSAVGLASIIRWQDVTFALVPAMLWVRHMMTERPPTGRVLRGILAAALTFCGIFSVQSAFWLAHHGRLLGIPQGGGFMHWGNPEVMHVLFSGWHGFFSWHPLLLPAACGILAWPFVCRGRALIPATLVACVLLQVYINSAALDWFAGSSFGGRRFSSSLPVFALGWALLFSWVPCRAWLRRSWRMLSVVLVACAGLLNLTLAALQQRRIHGAFVWDEMMLLGDVWREVGPQWLKTLLVGSQPVAHLVLERGHVFTGWGMLAVSAVVLAAALFFVLRAARFFSPRRQEIVAAGAAALCAAASLWVVAVRPQVSEEGLRLRSAVDSAAGAAGTGQEELSAALRALVQKNSSNPAVYLMALRVFQPMDSDTRQLILARLHKTAPHAWAMTILSLPRSQVSSAEVLAAALQPRPPGGVVDLLHQQVRFTNKSRIPARRIAALADVLRYAPFDYRTLAGLSEILEETGRRAEAEALRRRLVRALEARVRVVRRKGGGTGEFRGVLMANFGVPAFRALAELKAKEQDWGAVERLCGELKAHLGSDVVCEDLEQARIAGEGGFEEG